MEFEKMFDPFAGTGSVLFGLGTLCFGIAAIVKAWFDGRSKLVRANRGDPEVPALPRLLWRSAKAGVESNPSG
jgi:hypothetical protein